MNQFVKNLNRVEFVVTHACTGRCKHCSEGEHSSSGVHIEAEAAAGVVRDLAGQYAITSVMTFGGEPLLCLDTVYAVHAAAAECGIPRRQLITNGFFSRDSAKIKQAAGRLACCGVNDVLLSVDAFHQETIPLAPVKAFAAELCGLGVSLRAHPAWVVGKESQNPYNSRTAEILAEFASMGIAQSDGNIILPIGNARKYLCGYYDTDKEYIDPYEEDPADLRAISVNPDGSVLGGNIYRETVLEILERYAPQG